MSIDFYPAKLEGKHWQNAVPMQGDNERLCEAARKNESFEGEAFEPNPEYIPFSSLNMSSGNAMYILRLIGINPDPQDYVGSATIAEVCKKAHDFLLHGNGRVRDMDRYVFERVLALREMARLGISRGATHIVWA